MTPPALTDLDQAVFLRRDALADGYSDHQIRRLVHSGEWFRVRRGAYVSGVLWRSLSPADRHRVLCRAVLRTSHPSSVLTHTSAAIELGAPVWNLPLDEVHLTRTDGGGGRREAGVVHHRGELQTDHVMEIGGVPVSSAARCAVEITTVAPVESALVTVNGLLHDGRTTPKDFARLARDLRYWPASLSTDLVVRLADPRIESAGESRVSYLCWSQHLPKPQPQFEVRDESGWVFARVDFAWPGHGVFLEFDGKEKYLRFRRVGESLDEFLMREKRREEQICLLTGWVCVRITWADLGDPAGTARRVRRILDRRTPLGA